MAITAVATSEMNDQDRTALTENSERLPEMGKLWCVFLDNDFDQLDDGVHVRRYSVVAL